MIVALDIGAGSTYFIDQLRRKNKKHKIIGFSGEPMWQQKGLLGKLNRALTNEQAQKLINEDKQGTYKINSTYRNFEFDDSSLDFISVNSPHPLMPAEGIEAEVQRCLKPGGIFFYGHSTSFSVDFDENFQKLVESPFPKIKYWNNIVDLSKLNPNYPKDKPSIIVPSKVIFSNMLEKQNRDKNPNYQNSMGGSYLYNSIPLRPNFKVWIKN